MDAGSGGPAIASWLDEASDHENVGAGGERGINEGR
jgi:hypothetical protein